MTDPAPRVPQITDAERTADVQKMFAAMSGVTERKMDVTKQYVLKTFAQYPALTEPYLIFNRHLLSTSVLPVRLRQIAILRIAWMRAARYMWASHLRLSLECGLVAQDFEAIKAGPEASHWSTSERSIVRAVDQLCVQSDLDDANWQALSAHLDRRQIMDLLFTVGAYVLLGMTLNAMRVQREPELQELAKTYGSPG